MSLLLLFTPLEGVEVELPGLEFDPAVNHDLTLAALTAGTLTFAAPTPGALTLSAASGASLSLPAVTEGDLVFDPHEGF